MPLTVLQTLSRSVPITESWGTQCIRAGDYYYFDLSKSFDGFYPLESFYDSSETHWLWLNDRTTYLKMNQYVVDFQAMMLFTILLLKCVQ